MCLQLDVHDDIYIKHKYGEETLSHFTILNDSNLMGKATTLTKLLLRNAYWDIAQRANWNSFVLLSTATILDLKDWRHRLLTWNDCLANLLPCNVLLNTNASLTGWGASL